MCTSRCCGNLFRWCIQKELKVTRRMSSEKTTVSSLIEVHALTDSPDRVWQEMQATAVEKRQPCTEVPADVPCTSDKVRFVCISDTHGNRELMASGNWVPSGDVLIHAGDFTRTGRVQEVESFNAFLGGLPHHYKLVVAGNHEVTFDPHKTAHPADLANYWHINWADIENVLKEKNVASMKDLLTNCIYLEDSFTTVFGLLVYGSPWQPHFRNWAFNLPRGKMLLDKWNCIPNYTDVLITHGPPLGIGDKIVGGHHVGCVELYNTVMHRVKPKLHVFGHIHEDHGLWKCGETYFANAASLNEYYRPSKKPIVVDLPMPPGITKDDWLKEYPPLYTRKRP